MSARVLAYNPEKARTFAEEVATRSGQNLLACYQCRRCAAGCSVGEETGYETPDRLIRKILLGDTEGALNSDLAWRCVSCYTCGTRCPNDIQTARINETLKHMSKERHCEPVLPKVGAFHQSFTESAIRWGRLNEMEFMGLYAMRNGLHDVQEGDVKSIVTDLFEQAMMALEMVQKKRMHFGFQSSGGRRELKRLMKKAKTRGK